MSSPHTTPLNPTRELTKAFLFLRTASTAVTNTTAQLAGTKDYVQYYSNSVDGYYIKYCRYQEKQAKEEEELKKWEVRLVHAGVQIVDWAAKLSLGKWLPREIIEIIGDMIARDEDLVLRRIW